MSDFTITLIGASVLGLLLAGYVAQLYLPPPPPKLVGMDLGTTYSSIGVYQAVTGNASVLADPQGRRSIPSVVSFMPNGTIFVGYAAVAHAEHNPAGTIYDAKRFIGKEFTQAQLDLEAERYPFQVVLNGSRALFVVPDPANGTRLVSPEEVGALVLDHLLTFAHGILGARMTRGVISVPAEFDPQQRNATVTAANLAGVDIFRVINEPTAAALAYGLHRKPGVEHVMIVDLGGGTLDVSLLAVQAGMFLTRAMAGNNHLGGQDFNQRLFSHLVDQIKTETGRALTHPEDLQNLRQATEAAKLELTYRPDAHVQLQLHSLDHLFATVVTRDHFEALNKDLFLRILNPVKAALEDVGLDKSEVDEVVLVGGSTRIPRVRSLIREFFGKELSVNAHISPELAVVTGVAVQSGVMSGGWPLVVSAVELPAKLKKIHLYD